MLVLTRKKDQRIKLGDNITITLLEIKGDTIKIGIDAPKEVAIVRGELVDEVRASNVEATKVNKDLLKNLANFLKK